jgi:steroid Delta-isomerase
MTTPQHSKALTQAIYFFEHISPEQVAQLDQLYSTDAYFKDPFNEVRGIAPIKDIFAHMFVKVNQPSFKVLSGIENQQEAFLTWDFFLTFKGETLRRKIHGSSHLRFSPEEKIIYHRDYWDAAEELYEQLPVVGSLMRFLKRRANA